MATVSAGMVTAKAAGTATITAKTSNGKIASCTVTVTKPAESTAQTNFKKVVSYIETYYDGINSYGNKFISLAIDSNSIVGLSYESSENKLTITFLYETETTGGTSKNGVSINLCYNSLSKVSVEVLHILNDSNFPHSK